MPALLVWERESKKIHCCMTPAHGTVYTFEGLVSHIRTDWEDFFSSAVIDHDLTSNMAKAQIYIDESDQPLYRPEMPILIDTLSPVLSGSVATINLTSVPVGAELYIDDELKGVASEDSGSINFDLQGEYRLKLTLHPYLDFEEIINVI